MWINEGFTTFIENKISSQIHGEDFGLVEAFIGNQSLWVDIVDFGLNNTYGSLYPVLDGDNPDNSYSSVPYDKGFQLLYYLESLIGGENFRDFLRFWIQTNSLTSVTNIQLRASWEYFVSTRLTSLTGDEINKILKKVDFETYSGFLK